MKVDLRWLILAILMICGPMGARTQTPATEHGPFFNILDYGAKNDGSANAADAFKRAILAAKAAGGGTVFVPAGHYVSGPIEMVSNLTLDFDAGAMVEFPAAMLPFTPGRQQGVETLTPVPLIGGHDLENVAVMGRGVLTSNNTDWMKLHGRQQATGEDPGSANGPHWESLLNSLNAGKTITQDEYEAAAAELRPSFIRFMNSKNILVSGLRIIGSPMWTVHLLYSENATVENLVIETYPGVHTDGIVVDSSRFVRIANDYIDTGDDGIVIKSGKDADGLRVNRPTEDVTITNCTVHHAHGAVSIGSESSGGVRNIAMSHMTIDGAKTLVDIDGLPEMPIQNLHISDVMGTGKMGMSAAYTDGLELHDVQLNPAAGPAFAVEHAKNLELDDVTTSKPLAQTPVIRLDDAAGAVVRNSRAYPGTGVFVSTAKGELQKIVLEGNALGNAAIATQETDSGAR
jgi:polygalacturonase